jgi:aminomethyltransferase
VEKTRFHEVFRRIHTENNAKDSNIIVSEKGHPVSADSPLRTALHSLHFKYHGKMVDFAGYHMPVQYADGIKTEHLHTRSHAGLFDVSHMGQIKINGKSAAAAIERLVTGDILSLQNFQQRYTLLTNEQGGITDDLMVTKIPEGLFVVVNAACKQSDFDYIESVLSPECEIKMLSNHALLALQGPQAAALLGKINPAIAELVFMQAGQFELYGIPCFINRCGYTGEDGFEISVENEHAEHIAEHLLESEEVRPVGLGARDSLRLEAGLCLYGHDIDETTTPVEAQLVWALAKKYRDTSVPATFPGAEIILRQLQDGASKQLVGLRAEGKMPIREGVQLLNNEDVEIGHVSSGGFGPSFGGPVAMGYIRTEYAQSGTELHVNIRNRFHTIHVVDLPFVKHRYYKL